MKEEKMFYGWKIVVIAIISLALMWTLPITCFSLFLKPVSSDLGFERSAFALCGSIVSITAMFMSPFVGRWMEHKNVKVVVGLSVVGIAAGFLGYSISTSLPMFYAFALLIGISINGASLMAFSIIIKNWFIEKQGLAMSIALAGTGLGGMIMSPIINKMILEHGWRFAYQVLAALVIAVVLPLVIVFIRKRPQDMGLNPYGFGKELKAGKAPVGDLGMGVSELKSQPMFWIYMASIAMVGFSGGAVLLQAPAYISDQLSPTKAAAAVSAYLGIAIAGKIILGSVYDAKGSKAGIMLGCATMVLATLALLNVKAAPFYLAFILLHGFGTCSGTVTPPVLTSRLFGAKKYGEVYGMTNFFLQGGMALGSPTIAFFYDKTGTYTYAWYLCAAINILAIIGLIYASNTSRKMLESR